MLSFGSCTPRPACALLSNSGMAAKARTCAAPHATTVRLDDTPAGVDARRKMDKVGGGPGICTAVHEGWHSLLVRVQHDASSALPLLQLVAAVPAQALPLLAFTPSPLPPAPCPLQVATADRAAAPCPEDGWQLSAVRAPCSTDFAAPLSPTSLACASWPVHPFQYSFAAALRG